MVFVLKPYVFLTTKNYFWAKISRQAHHYAINLVPFMLSTHSKLMGHVRLSHADSFDYMLKT